MLFRSLTIGYGSTIWRLLLWTGAGLVWGTAVVAGFGLLCVYEATPGVKMTAPDSWPANTSLTRDTSRPCLLVALHPHCPCSQATIDELEVIVQQSGDRLAVQILFYVPRGRGSEWAHSEQWTRAKSLAGVQVRTDEDGIEAKKFGAATSGHAVLFGADGLLQYCGGLTRARGQAGDNDGRLAILAHVLSLAREPLQADVFGCPLCGPARLDDSTGERICSKPK